MKKFLKAKINLDSFPKILFILSLCLISFGYGYLAFMLELFPHSIIRDGILLIDEIISPPEVPWYYVKTDYSTTVPVYIKNSTYDGLSFVTSIIEDDKLAVSIIDMKGDLVHRWDINWFELWPDAAHISESAPDYPQSQPGTHIHGALVLENGDLIFNFTNLGMVRMDVCGNVVWKLGYRTHHSIHMDEDGNLWAPGMIKHYEPVPDLPSHQPLFTEDTILKVSLDGEILKEISVFEIFKKNDLEGLLNLSSLDDPTVYVSGDTLHLNDVETFPRDFEEGVFAAGDIMLSLRNINTILIFREEDLKVTQVSTGAFVRQHDPDFIDGNTISVFDNYNIAPEDFGHHSRILIRSFADGQQYIHYTGTEEQPFYTAVMGNHQWLPNGNLLITESDKGRAFEIDPQGNIVWEYINIVDEGYTGIVEDVQRLPDFFTEDYFSQITKACSVEDSD
jgi:hypothetical protein